jgi:hypothetical protein
MVLGYILGDFLQTHLATLVNYFIRTILQVTKKTPSTERNRVEISWKNLLVPSYLFYCNNTTYDLLDPWALTVNFYPRARIFKQKFAVHKLNNILQGKVFAIFLFWWENVLCCFEIENILPYDGGEDQNKIKT